MSQQVRRPGTAAQPKTLVKYNIQLPASLSDQMEDMAEDREMTPSQLIAELVLLGLKSLQYDLRRTDPTRGIDPSAVGSFQVRIT